ncbi:MAG: exonuclease domain-containing protein [Ignavibacteriales bacterium]
MSETTHKLTTDTNTSQAYSDLFGVAGFVDVETTGLNPNYDEIIELSLYLFEFRKDNGEILRIVEKYTGLREPSIPISIGAQRVNNITYEELKDKRLDIQHIECLIDKAEFLIAHNASFDRGFLSRLIDKCNNKTWLCSINNIDWKGKGFKSRALGNLLNSHGIFTSRAHRAEDDVCAAIKLLSLKTQNGKTYFYEMLKNANYCICD